MQFSPDVETQLQRAGASNGKNAEQLVKDTVNRMLESQAVLRFGRGERHRAGGPGRAGRASRIGQPHRRALSFVRQIRWTDEASKQFVAAVKAIEEDNPTAALNVARAVIVGIDKLATFPGMGRPGEIKGTRELVCPPYVAVYRYTDESSDRN